MDKKIKSSNDTLKTDAEKENELKEEKENKKKMAEEYCKTIEAKLRKAERHTWMVKDHDFSEQ